MQTVEEGAPGGESLVMIVGVERLLEMSGVAVGEGGFGGTGEGVAGPVEDGGGRDAASA